MLQKNKRIKKEEDKGERKRRKQTNKCNVFIWKVKWWGPEQFEIVLLIHQKKKKKEEE